MAFEVRGCGSIHRLRDKASEWPIRVRVTTANAGCVSTRILNVDRRRPMVKAVPARAPTGSSWSLPPCRRERNPRHPPSHAHVSARRAMSATRAPRAGGLKAEDRVIACPKGPAIGHAHRHHRTAVTLAARPLRRSRGAGQVRGSDHAGDRVCARPPGACVHRRQRREGLAGPGLPAVRTEVMPDHVISSTATWGAWSGASRCRCAKDWRRGSVSNSSSCAGRPAT